MQSISISEARANMKSLVDRVVADKAPIAITRQKGEGALADKLHGVTLAFARVVVSTGTAFAETVLATEVITARIRG